MANTKIPSELSSTPSISDSGDSTAITIDSSERVGFGTGSPTTAKVVISHASSELGLHTTGSYNYQAKFESTDAEAAIVIEDSNSTNDGNRIGVITNDMTFITNNSERMRVDSAGHIGINDSNPSANSSSLVTLNVGGGIMTKNTANASTNYVFESRYSGSNNLTFGYKGNGSTHTASLIGSQNNLPLSIEVGGSERLKIDSSGNITTPSNPAFDVSDANGASQANTKTFATVYVNKGSHYNTSNGRFTAPVAGTYLFYTSYIKNGSVSVHRRVFIKNGSTSTMMNNGRQLRLDSDNSGGQQYGDNGYLIVMATLAANDYVQVYQSVGNSYGAHEYEVFGGYLIG